MNTKNIHIRIHKHVSLKIRYAGLGRSLRLEIGVEDEVGKNTRAFDGRDADVGCGLKRIRCRVANVVVVVSAANSNTPRNQYGDK